MNKLYNLDCLEGFKLVEDSSIDLIVTSPPYNLGIQYDSWNDNLPWNEYLKWCKLWLKQCYRVLKDDGRICINHYIACRGADKIDKFPLIEIKTIQEQIGFKVSKIIIWEDKSRSCFTAWGSWMSASSPHIQTPYEGILVSYKKQWLKNFKGINTISKQDFIFAVSGVWDIGTSTNKDVPAVFPLKLPQLCIELLSFKDDIVLDPFVGSGTTLVAAKMLNRKYIGFELSPNYFAIAQQRLKQINIPEKLSLYW